MISYDFIKVQHEACAREAGGLNGSEVAGGHTAAILVITLPWTPLEQMMNLCCGAMS